MSYALGLVEQVRRRTLNTDETTTAGIPDENFLDYLNEATERLASVVATHAKSFFETTEEISLVGGHSASFVEYSDTGDSEDYCELKFGSINEFINAEWDDPTRCLIRNGQVLVSPVPQSSKGKLRVTYARLPDYIDKRRGTIVSNTDTTIVVANDSTLSLTNALVEAASFLCVVDSAGSVQNYALPATAYDSGTFTITGTFTGLTFSANDYVVLGKYTSSHWPLPRNWERYAVHYATRAIQANEDSSVDVTAEDPILTAIERDIIEGTQVAQSFLKRQNVINRFYV